VAVPPGPIPHAVPAVIPRIGGAGGFAKPSELAVAGQFLRGDGGLYQPRVAAFVQAFERATTPAELVAAFPLARLDLLGSIDDVLAWLQS